MSQIILLLVLLVTLTSHSNAQGVDNPDVFKASFPDCAALEVAGAAGAVLGLTLGSIGAYNAFMISQDHLTKPILLGLFLGSVGGLASTAYSGTAITLFLKCRYSFVHHPVLRFHDGTMKTCLDPIKNPLSSDDDPIMICPTGRYEPTESYEWPKNAAMHGDYIHFCARSPIHPTIIPSIISSVLGDTLFDEVIPREKEVDEVLNKIKGQKILSRDIVRGELKCAVLKAGESTEINNVEYAAQERDGNKLCVIMRKFHGIPVVPIPTVGCHMRPPSPPAPMCQASKPVTQDGEIVGYDNSGCFNCYVSQACYGKTTLAAQSPVPITSLVVQCISESLNNVLTGNCKDALTGLNNEGFLLKTTRSLSKAIKAIIVLAVIMFAFKMMLGAVQGRGEYLMMIIKISLVIYFTAGDGLSFYYKQLVNFSVGLGDLVMSTGGNPTICNFTPDEYKGIATIEDGKHLQKWEEELFKEHIKTGNKESIQNVRNIQSNHYQTFSEHTEEELNNFLHKIKYKDFEYIAPWDRLDCRFMFYLGQSLVPLGAAGAAGGIGILLSVISPFALILLLIPALLFAGQIIAAIMLLLFSLMIVCTIIWIVYIYIISMIALALIAILGPIFIPMCLFQSTKSFFDGWVKELIAYSLYPIILFSFLALMLSAFDQMYFEDLTFERYKTGVKEPFNVKPLSYFKLSPEDQCTEVKKHCSSGYIEDNEGNSFCAEEEIVSDPNTIPACIIQNVKFVTKPLILGINVTSADILADTGTLWKKFGIMALIGFLFYHFLTVISQLAAELSGSWRAGQISDSVTSPSGMAKKGLGMATKVGSTAKSAANKIPRPGGKGKDGGSSSETGKGGDGGKGSSNRTDSVGKSSGNSGSGSGS